MSRSKQRILFLCTGNSARSQMAEGLLREAAGDRWEALSAGTNPAGLNPLAVEVMGEIGIDIAGQRSKVLDEFVDQPIDVVVTVCDRARESCPIFPRAGRMLHWSFEDPAAAAGTEAERRDRFRAIRDEIRARIERFLHEA